MNTYIVTIDYTHECEVRHHKVSADDVIEAVLQAGAFAGHETEGNVGTLRLLAVEQIVESRKKVWG